MSDQTNQESEKIVQPTPSWMWIKDSQGNPSASLTFLTIAFWVTTVSFVASILTKAGTVEFRPFDAGACAAYLTPLLTLYFGRRFTDAKFMTSSKE